MLVFASFACESVEAEYWWVFLKDKGPTGIELEKKLEARKLEISPRALERRRRAGKLPLVDLADVEVHRPYLAQIAKCGVEIRTVSRWLNAVGVRADEKQLNCLKRLSFVKELLPLSRAERQEESPGRPRQYDFNYGEARAQLELIGIDKLHACGLNGKGVVVGVLDTGFSLAHRALSGTKVVGQYDFINQDEQTADEPEDPPGQQDHGTKVLSLIAGRDEGFFYGASPDAEFLLAKVIVTDTPDEADSDRWVAGLEWLEEKGADIVTSSIGFCANCPVERLDGKTEPTTKAARLAVERGLIVLNSAGNRGPEPMTINAPADADGVIAVGSVDLERRVAVDSSRGPTYDGRIKPDIMAPGVEVVMVDPAGEGYIRRSGTSFATPLAAGAVALLKQAFPELTPTEMLRLITSTASRADNPTSDYGWGLLQAAQAAGLFCSCHDQDGDGHYDSSCGGDDCDDQRGDVFPGAQEICDSVDNDCDGSSDEAPSVCLVQGCGCSSHGRPLTSALWICFWIMAMEKMFWFSGRKVK